MVADRLLIIHNPHAGALQPEDQRIGARTTLAEIRKTLASRHDWIETESPGDATHIVRDITNARFGCVVAVGGDGTVHEVVNGLMSVPPHLRPSLGILPTGSGNDFAHAAGVPFALRPALDVILRGKAREVDIGRVSDDQGKVAYFDNTLGIGFDAWVTMQALQIRKLRGFARYFAATLKTIARHHTPFEVDLELDNLRFTEQALMITVGNGPREGGGFVTTPSSRIDDGRFELLLIKPISRPMMLALLPKVVRGEHLNSPSVYLRPFRSLRIRSANHLAVHIDGEIFADEAREVRELTIDIDLRAIRVLS